MISKDAVRSVVLDTSVLYARSQPWQIPDLAALHPVAYIVPPTVLWELDRLIERPETRGRARAALNTLKLFVERGAYREAVSCGTNATIRLASSDETDLRPGLRADLADDQILMCALAIPGDTYLATTEFALYAKALSFGLQGVFLESEIASREEVPLRERVHFKNTWRRVESADSPGVLADRLQAWLSGALVQRETEAIVQAGQPAYVVGYINEFRALWATWTSQVGLMDALKATMSLGVAIPTINYGVLHVQEPVKPAFSETVEGAYSANFMRGRTRPETADERAIRISAEQNSQRRAEQLIVERVLQRAEAIKECIVERVGDSLS